MELTSGFIRNMSCDHDRSSAKFRNAVLVTKNESAEDVKYEGWNFNSGNYLFTTDTK